MVTNYVGTPLCSLLVPVVATTTSIPNSWWTWAHTPSTSEEQREEAMQRLLACIVSTRRQLDLSQLNLTTLPPDLPDSLSVLDISHNRLTCLTEPLPSRLIDLDAGHNQLNQLPVRLPDSLAILGVNNNQLTQLPAVLPPLLKGLNIRNNRLQQLPPLPCSLQILDADNNQLIALPAVLPDSLTKLSVDNNQLIQLPALLPRWLIQLQANNNQLLTLPASLPPWLKKLELHSNKLTQLPSLPPSLEYLDISNNRLIELSTPLPSSLIELNVSENQLRQLPKEVMSTSLERLYADNNELTTLPEPLPDSLIELAVRYNDIEQLPTVLPRALKQLHADYNLLSHLPAPLPIGLEALTLVGNNHLNALPATLPPTLSSVQLNPHLMIDLHRQAPWLDVQHPLSESFIEKIGHWTPMIEPWHAIEAEPYAAVFAHFLQKLYAGYNRQSSLLQTHLVAWLDYLAKEEHQLLRAHTFLVADEAISSCVDRASFYFNQMYTFMIDHQLAQNRVPLATLFSANLALFRLQLLEKIARQSVVIRRQQGAFSDDIELYLAYQYQLRHRLSLPIYTELQHINVALLSPIEVQHAERMVRKEELVDFIRYLVIQSSSWQARLIQWNSTTVQAVDARYLQEIESDQFNQLVTQTVAKYGLASDDSEGRQQVTKQCADELLYQRRYRLTRLFLIEHQALHLVDRFKRPE